MITSWIHSLRRIWGVLIILGAFMMLGGAVDPLEGSFVILPGVALVALGAWLRPSRHWRLLLLSFALVLTGVAAMVALTAWGGVGGSSGHSVWWLLLCLPYPVGWLMSLVGVVALLIEGRASPVSAAIH